MAERAFAEKLEKSGFVEITVSDRIPYGVDDVASYPLFTPELVDLMRRVIPAECQGRVATSVVVHARKPGG